MSANPFARPCGEPHCDLQATGLSPRCLLHETVANARYLGTVEYDLLRSTLDSTTPLSDEEKRSRRATSLLRDVQWKARDLKRAKKAARASGATAGQVDKAVATGKRDA